MKLQLASGKLVPSWHRDFGQITHNGCVIQPKECGKSFVQKVHLADKDVAGFRTRWNFSHEVRVGFVFAILKLAGAGVPSHRDAAGTLNEIFPCK